MPGTVDLIIFGMEASIRLSRKILEIYQDDMANREILYPLAESTGPFTFEGALQFFRTRGSLLVEEGAVYHDLWTKIGPGGDAPLEVLDQFEVFKTQKEGENITREESAELAEKLQSALNQLDELSYPPDEPIAIYANQQKLVILGNILDIWSAYSRSGTERERAQVIEKAIEICGQFPDDYPSKELTQELARKRLGLE